MRVGYGGARRASGGSAAVRGAGRLLAAGARPGCLHGCPRPLPQPAGPSGALQLPLADRLARQGRLAGWRPAAHHGAIAVQLGSGPGEQGQQRQRDEAQARRRAACRPPHAVQRCWQCAGSDDRGRGAAWSALAHGGAQQHEAWLMSWRRVRALACHSRASPTAQTCSTSRPPHSHAAGQPNECLHGRGAPGARRWAGQPACRRHPRPCGPPAQLRRAGAAPGGAAAAAGSAAGGPGRPPARRLPGRGRRR